jgi:hydrocephalus-inducing protein
LDFPDVISFSDVPVRYKSTKTLLIRNIGSRDSKFTIETKGPFDIIPDHGFIKTGSSMQLEVQFYPKVFSIINIKNLGNWKLRRRNRG